MLMNESNRFKVLRAPQVKRKAKISVQPQGFLVTNVTTYENRQV